MDGSLSRMRGKADFRLMRELLGLPQEWVAKRVGVDARTVRNWESPRYFYPPKREAWDLEGPSGGRGCGHVEGRERGGAPGRGPSARHGPAGRDRVRGARGVTDTVGVI